jgi:hypothetical protein
LCVADAMWIAPNGIVRPAIVDCRCRSNLRRFEKRLHLRLFQQNRPFSDLRQRPLSGRYREESRRDADIPKPTLLTRTRHGHIAHQQHRALARFDALRLDDWNSDWSGEKLDQRARCVGTIGIGADRPFKNCANLNSCRKGSDQLYAGRRKNLGNDYHTDLKLSRRCKGACAAIGAESARLTR